MSATDVGRIIEKFTNAIDNTVWSDEPYRHGMSCDVFPAETVAALQAIDFPIGELGGRSGARELHNDQRHYFNAETMETNPVIKAVSTALHSSAVASKVADTFETEIDGTLLRLEYAQDINGFWLQPHTDLGVKKFTMLIYLSDGDGHDMLGTDIYKDQETWSKRTPFAPNIALSFKPADATWHGFEQREVKGVRKTLIFNYVTTDWRDREQLAFADQLVKTH